LTLNESIEFLSPAITSVKLPSSGVGVPSYSLPFMESISPKLKKQIIEGRDVNLAALLMKDYEAVQAACSLHTSSGHSSLR
jgi:hypothetical protein